MCSCMVHFSEITLHRESITQVLSTMEERKDQQETGLCKHSQLCVGHTSGKSPDNIVTGVTVLQVT